jgi:hypothetical protein
MAIPFAAALKYWKLLGIALLVLAIGVQTIRLSGAERRADRAEFHLREARAELQRISSAKNQQGETTQRNIGKARDRATEAEKGAGRIESSPLPGNCKTPPAILELDI